MTEEEDGLDEEEVELLNFFNYIRAMFAVFAGMLIEKKIITPEEFQVMEDKAREMAAGLTNE